MVDRALPIVGVVLKNGVVFNTLEEFLEVLPGHADFLLEPAVVKFVKEPVQAV